MPVLSSSNTRRTHRKILRAQRRALSRKQQQRASRKLASQLHRIPELQRAKHIAAYLPIDGEIDPREAMQLLRARGKRLLLPILGRRRPNRRMTFATHSSTNNLRRGRFNTSEPLLTTRRMPAWALDVVLLPLVGFDRAGNRLGMGGGFYDRCFAISRKQRSPRWPYLLGLAHDCQQLDTVAAQDWDVELDAVLTPGGLVRITGA